MAQVGRKPQPKRQKKSHPTEENPMDAELGLLAIEKVIMDMTHVIPQGQQNNSYLLKFLAVRDVLQECAAKFVQS